jgi:phosphohistidine swiveling domain-containing protein
MISSSTVWSIPIAGHLTAKPAAESLKNGDLVTVDGHLGIVTVGAAEFDLELGVGVSGPDG